MIVGSLPSTGVGNKHPTLGPLASSAKGLHCLGTHSGLLSQRSKVARRPAMAVLDQLAVGREPWLPMLLAQEL